VTAGAGRPCPCCELEAENGARQRWPLLPCAELLLQQPMEAPAQQRHERPAGHLSALSAVSRGIVSLRAIRAAAGVQRSALFFVARGDPSERSSKRSGTAQALPLVGE
jgi:hypothetical protein